jgi:hypothetical protein
VPWGRDMPYHRNRPSKLRLEGQDEWQLQGRCSDRGCKSPLRARAVTQHTNGDPTRSPAARTANPAPPSPTASPRSCPRIPAAIGRLSPSSASPAAHTQWPPSSPSTAVAAVPRTAPATPASSNSLIYPRRASGRPSVLSAASWSSCTWTV